MFGIGDFFDKSHPAALWSALAVAGGGVALALGMGELGLLSLTELFGPVPLLGLAGWAAIVGAATGLAVGNLLQGEDAGREDDSGKGEVATRATASEGPGQPELSCDAPEQEAERTFRDRVTPSTSASAGRGR
jgi:hypothetical protein